jgi:hypothetical protein
MKKFNLYCGNKGCTVFYFENKCDYLMEQPNQEFNLVFYSK